MWPTKHSLEKQKVNKQNNKKQKTGENITEDSKNKCKYFSNKNFNIIW